LGTTRLHRQRPSLGDIVLGGGFAAVYREGGNRSAVVYLSGAIFFSLPSGHRGGDSAMAEAKTEKGINEEVKP